MTNLIIYYLILSTIGFMLCSLDKYLATKHYYRISEKTFFILAYLGGAFGIICAMYMWRHKTIKKSFKNKIFLGFLINILLFLFFYYKINLGYKNVIRTSVN